MATLGDFIRWAHPRVIERPEIARYKLLVLNDDEHQRVAVNEFDLDHDAECIYLFGDGDEVAFDADYDPPDPV